MYGQDDSFVKYFCQNRCRDCTTIGACMDKRNTWCVLKNFYSFDQCPKHKTDSTFSDSIDDKVFFVFLDGKLAIKMTGKQSNGISFCQ